MRLRTLYSLLDIGPIKSKTALKRLSGIAHIRAILAFRILITLKKHYEHYAFSEIIKSSNGQAIFIYDFRDAEFEAELKRHGMTAEIRPALHPRKDLYMSPYTNMRRKPLFREFEMTSHLMVRENQTIVPKRNNTEQPKKENIRKKVIIEKENKKEEKPQPRIIIRIEGAEVDNSF